jgi:hypothetical protein
MHLTPWREIKKKLPGVGQLLEDNTITPMGTAKFHDISHLGFEVV